MSMIRPTDAACTCSRGTMCPTCSSWHEIRIAIRSARRANAQLLEIARRQARARTQQERSNG